jgi:hypothetical protein
LVAPSDSISSQPNLTAPSTPQSPTSSVEFTELAGSSVAPQLPHEQVTTSTDDGDGDDDDDEDDDDTPARSQKRRKIGNETTDLISNDADADVGGVDIRRMIKPLTKNELKEWIVNQVPTPPGFWAPTKYGECPN